MALRSRFKRVVFQICKGHICQKFIKFIWPKNTIRITQKTRTSLFPNLKHQKLIFFENFTLAKRFFQTKTSIKAKGVPFDQVKIVLKNVAQCRKKIFSTIIEKTHKFHKIEKKSKKSHCAEKRKRGDPLGFLSSSWVQKLK